MNYIEKQQMKPYGLYMWTHRSNIRIKVCEPNMLCDEIMKPKRGLLRVLYTLKDQVH